MPTIKRYELPKHIVELAKRFDERAALANVIDANGFEHSDENGQFVSSGSGGTSGNDNDRPNGGFKAEKYRGGDCRASGPHLCPYQPT